MGPPAMDGYPSRRPLPTAWLLKASAADLIQRPSVRVVLLNERRGRREELNLPTAPIDRGDLDCGRPVSTASVCLVSIAHTEIPSNIGDRNTKVCWVLHNANGHTPIKPGGVFSVPALATPISVPAMPRPWARALMEAIGRLSFTIINVRLFPACDIDRRRLSSSSDQRWL